MEFVDYYSILDLDSDAAIIEIKKAYKKQCFKWHPDRNPDNDTTIQMQLIIEANLILSDVEAKGKYDKQYAHYYKSDTVSKSTDNSKSDEKGDRSTFEEEPSYSSWSNNYHKGVIDDEDLARWMRNARSQSRSIYKEVVDEFAGATKEAGSTLLHYFLYLIVPMFISSLLFRGCS